MATPIDPSYNCEGLTCEDPTQPASYCGQCTSHFCDACWPIQPAHLPTKRNEVNGPQHEKANLRISERIGRILNPTKDPSHQAELHKQDVKTTWFGVVEDPTGAPALQDYGRYGKLMQEGLSAQYPVRYPQLVSFIGQTGTVTFSFCILICELNESGDGKSTIIKLLIDHQEMARDVVAEPMAASPVVGLTDDPTPTSGNVHLYADPATKYSSRPLLYADCEGLQGGEITPGAVKSKDGHLIRSQKHSGHISGHISGHRLPTAIRGTVEKVKAMSRGLSWANTPERREREFAVTELYPRLLYTFSDVIVFVLRNSR
jgi:hypothetical protein